MTQVSFANEKPSLYLIATPIGNLKELNERTIETLKKVAIVFCEDTRVTRKILQYLQIKKPLIALHEYNETEKIKVVLAALTAQQDVAVLSDAGYPLISDPGYQLVKAVIAQNFNVITISGASAFLNALVCSGLPPYPFTFYGFLSNKTAKLITQLTELKYRSETLIFYLSVHQLEKTLTLMAQHWGERQICLARELTKMYETIYRTTLTEIIKLDLQKLKGEFVLVVSGYQDEVNYENLSLSEHVTVIAKKQKISIKAAIKEVAQLRKIPTSIVYQAYHKD